MSKLEELIQALCPEGVEFRALGSFATVSRGGSFQKKDFCENGVPCIHYGQIYTRYGLFASHAISSISAESAKKARFAAKNDIIMAVTSENIEDVCKCVAWLGDESIAVSGHTALIRHDQNPKYLAYYFHSAMFFAQKRKLAHGIKVIEVTPSKLENIEIPLPPLPVQREIVRILDVFTAREAELKTELEAELEKRKAQCAYYRDQLLTFGNNVESIPVAKLCNISRGRVMSRDYLRENAGIYPVYSSQTANGGIFGHINSFDYDCESITWTTDGANAGSVFYHINKKFSITNVCGLLKVNNPLITTRYLFHCLQKLAKSYVSSGMGNPKLMSAAMSRIAIPVPSLPEQQRIVAILDRFQALVNNITQDLPAEIAARRKQYEYYRDKLLTFPPKEGAQ